MTALEQALRNAYSATFNEELEEIKTEPEYKLFSYYLSGNWSIYSGVVMAASKEEAEAIVKKNEYGCEVAQPKQIHIEEINLKPGESINLVSHEE